MEKKFDVAIDIWDGRGKTPNGYCSAVYLTVTVSATNCKEAEQKVCELLRSDSPIQVTFRGMKMSSYRVKAKLRK